MYPALSNTTVLTPFLIAALAIASPTRYAASCFVFPSNLLATVLVKVEALAIVIPLTSSIT